MKTKLSDYELATIAYHRDTLGVNPVAVDVASRVRVMQVCYYDSDKKLLKNFQLTRSKFFEFVEKAPEPLLFGIEACGSCNYLSRYFESKGHQCRIIPASKVKAFLKLDKNDKIDASGIFKAMLSSVESIPAKSLEVFFMSTVLWQEVLVLKHLQRSLWDLLMRRRALSMILWHQRISLSSKTLYSISSITLRSRLILSISTYKSMEARIKPVLILQPFLGLVYRQLWH